jgi:hypothetical protein
VTCRETGAGSALTTYARLATGNRVSDPAVLSTFHSLIREYNDFDESSRTQYTSESYFDFLDRQENRINNLSSLTVRQRESMLARLQRARTEPVPDQATIYALRNITPNVRSRANAIDSYIYSAASRMGVGAETLRERFNEHLNNTSRNRSARSQYLSQNNLDFASRLNVGRDVAIVNAVNRIEEEVVAVEIARFRNAPQRITEYVTITSERGAGGNNPNSDVSVSQIGYDPRIGRLEVVVNDAGAERRYAYRNVPNEIWENMSAPRNNATAIWENQVRGNTDFQYSNETQAAQDGCAPRCATCGQFADASHACPFQEEPRRLTRYTTSSRWSSQRVSVDMNTMAYGEGGERIVTTETRELPIRLPAIREFRSLVDQGPVKVEMPYLSFENIYEEPDLNNPGETRIRWTRASLSGDALVMRDENGELQIKTNGLRCSCPEYRENSTCKHVGIIEKAVRERLTPTPRAPGQRRGRMTAEQRAEMLMEAQRRSEELAANTDWMLDEEKRREAQQTWLANSEVSYASDFEAFYSDYQAAKDRAAAKNGEPDIPYMRENALNGLAQRGSGKGFGMEIEFDIEPGRNKGEAILAIAQELHAEGLTWADTQQSYRASQHRGFRDTHADENGVGNWTLERDGSVDAELVTPVMYDEPETWEKLDKAVAIIRKHGGIPSRRAGAHVHVGTPEYASSPQSYSELARLMNQHEDVMYRVSADPKRGGHRNNGYSRPMPAMPQEGFADVSQIRRWNYQRYSTINFAGIDTTGADGSKDHPEFRIFDSTLNPGAMQTQIKLAVSMTDAAHRIAQQGGSQREKEPVGSHAQRFAARGTRVALTKDELEADTRTLRSFLDTIFTRKEDKAQVAAIFASTKWAKLRGR